jgi:MoaA/NifB/PqqE/SkfB family radical SAM enzyme
MNDLIKINSNLPRDYLRIELFLSNVCNYSCWYCSPEYHSGSHRWPKLEQVKDNLGYIIDYYRKNTPKRRVCLFIIGGEPTLWPDFEKFIKYFKEEYDCIISMSTNGSRTLRWWKEHGDYVDDVVLSCHHETVDVDHIKAVADILYKKGKWVNALVLMDPKNWYKCVRIVESLRSSQYRWPITVRELVGVGVTYTKEERNYLSIDLKRMPWPWYWFTAKKTAYRKPTVFFSNGIKKKVPLHWILGEKLNKFKGWSCNIGIDTFFIDKTGEIMGACSEKLYQQPLSYNIYDPEFKSNFKPEIKPVICSKQECICQPEINTRKYRIIPIQQD